MVVSLVVNNENTTKPTYDELMELVYAGYAFIIQDSKSERRKNSVLEAMKDALKDTGRVL